MVDDVAKRASLRGAGTAQGVVLCLFSLVSVAAALLLAPVLPKLVAHFQPIDPAAEGKAILALTAPALLVALTSPVIGKVVDTIGRRLVLNVALFFYGLFGIAPFFLDNLNMIIVSRLILGVLEGAVMTSATTLLGDYFEGRDREKWLVMQTTFTSLFSIVFMAVGGALGELGWQAPFLVYGMALVALPISLITLFEPESHAHEPASGGRFPWRSVIFLYPVALLSSILFFVVPIQLPFILTQNGISSTQVIGLTSAAGAVAVPVGSFVFKARAGKPLAHNLALSFGLMAAGFVLMVATADYGVIVAGVIVASLGAGIILPTMLTAIMKRLTFDMRGRGMGGWTTAFFFGNFIGPVIILALTGVLGHLSSSILVLAGVAAIGMIAAFVLGSPVADAR